MEKKSIIKNKRKIVRKKAISFIEIFIMVLSTIAFSYLISDEFLVSATDLTAEQRRQAEIALRSSGEDNAARTIDIPSLIDDLSPLGDNPLVYIASNLRTTFERLGPPPYGCCKLMKSGATCQALLNNEEQSKCADGQFVPSQECKDVDGCELGCCIDTERGICESGSSRDDCSEGTWLGKEEDGEGAENCELTQDTCKKGCCILGISPVFVTKKECDSLASFNGLVGSQYTFKDDIETEGGCLLESYALERGACITEFELGYRCQMMIDDECRTGVFFSNDLCTNPQFKEQSFHDPPYFTEETRCKPKTKNADDTEEYRTTCVDGRDEVYFLDSCGNIANIYDADKTFEKDPEYWNKVVEKSDSCGNDDLDASGNSQTCGNCWYLRGSRCTNWTAEKEADLSFSVAQPTHGEFYCKDMDCNDAKYYGQDKPRKNGESWCIYDGWVGNFPYDALGEETSFVTDILQGIPGAPELPYYFGKDVVGSRHWKYRCVEGNVTVDGCQDYRNQICQETEQKDEESGRTFSVASCKVNRWRECFATNQDPGSLQEIISMLDSQGDNPFFSIISSIAGSVPIPGGDIAKRAAVVAKCATIPDCIYKHVSIDDDFNIGACLPKYPPGFDLATAAGKQDASKLCKVADQKCTAVYVKDGFPVCKWKCIANCDCREKEFAEKLNEFCVSLGDCGSYVNIKGQALEGYNVNSKTPFIQGLGAGYRFFATPIPGYKIPPNQKEIEEATGTGGGAEGSEGEGGEGSLVQGPGEPPEPSSSESWKIVGVSAAAAGATGAVLVAVPAISSLAGTGTFGGFGAAFTGLYGAGGAAPFLAGAFSVAAVAAIAGLGAALLYGNAPIAVLGTVATMAGVAAVATIATWGSGGWGCFSMGPAAPICLAILIVILTIMKLQDCGEIKYVDVEFKCQASKPPMITDENTCKSCNEDSLKQCTPYRCQSLGRQCRFTVDSDTGYGLCVYVESEANAPIISWWDEDINKGFSQYYEPINIERMTENKGMLVKYTGDGADSEGRVPAFKEFSIGIKTDEYAECRIGRSDSQTFDEMTDNLETEDGEKHKISLTIPSVNYAFAQASSTTEETADDVASGEAVNPETADMSISLEEYRAQAEDLRFYIKCADWWDNKNDAAPYIVMMRVKDLPDYSPPLIESESASPGNGRVFIMGTTSKEVTIFVRDESNVNCKWSKTIGKPYDEMEGVFDCDKVVSVNSRYRCITTLQLPEENNLFYFKCQDTSENKNTNSQDISYVLKVSDKSLVISAMDPQDGAVIESGGDDSYKKDITVETEGGVGTVTCQYKLDSFSFDDMESVNLGDSSNNRKTHVKEEVSVSNGGEKRKSHKIEFKCQDSIGNNAEDSTDFELILDDEGPKLVDVDIAALTFGSIKITTDEEATCYHNPDEEDSCSFNIDETFEIEGVRMSTSDGLTHFVETCKPGRTYWIRCKDEPWGNGVNACIKRGGVDESVTCPNWIGEIWGPMGLSEGTF